VRKGAARRTKPTSSTALATPQDKDSFKSNNFAGKFSEGQISPGGLDLETPCMKKMGWGKVRVRLKATEDEPTAVEYCPV
jgi:hypothetical protein